MTAYNEIKSNVNAVGAIDWDRRLFDELIPLPDGTSYNSYLVQGTEKTALIDTVDPSKTDVLLRNLGQLNPGHIDYIIANHAEQDHSGSIPVILQKFSDAQVVCTAKCKDMLIDLLGIPEKQFKVVSDGEILSIGNRTLQFIHTPWVHWPETMVSYLREEKLLFTCDFFGSHLATSDLYVTDNAQVLQAAKRYYAEIMMPFRIPIRSNMKKLEPLDINMIAPSHGPIYREPKLIMDAYRDWISDTVKNEVVIPYVSMHHSTARMVEYLTDALVKRGITVKPFNLTHTDIGELAMALVDTATIVIGTPTVLTGPHPLAVYGAYLANALRPKLKYASVIGSYGWGGKSLDILTSMIPNIKAELLKPVLIKGYPREEHFKALDDLADQIEQKHREEGIIEVDELVTE
ncbi:MAG: FprA family A-type flavoprotein [Candidatus Latescibacteria bacterium]|nr:FprA family A-type flavoprotein [Candidatus Latescibacterota bacterium]